MPAKKSKKGNPKKNSSKPAEIISPIKILIRTGIFIALLLPLVFFPPLYDIYDLSKVTVLRFITIWIILLIIYLILTRSEIELPRTKLAIPIVVLLLAIILSTVFSINPVLSLLGGIKRHEGLPTFFSYLLMFWVAATYFERKDWSKFETLIACATLLVSIYGIFQRFGVDFMNFGGTKYDITRAFATTGNPVFLGQYLAFTAPFLAARALMFGEKNNARRIFLTIVAVLAIVCAIFTYSRASWIGILVALLILGWVAAKRIIKGWKILVVLLIGVLLFGYMIEKNRQESGAASESLFTRAQTIFDLSKSTRVSMWRSTIPIIKERPFIGYGLETYKGVFPRYRELMLIKMEGEFSMPDRPHNEPLYLIYSFGLFGFTAFLWIIIAFAWKSLRFIKVADKDIAQFVVASGIGVISYNVTNFSSFSTANTTAGYWALLGFAASVMSSGPKYILKLPKIPIPMRVGIVGAFLVISVFCINLSLKVFLSDLHYNKARFENVFKRYDIARQNAERAVALNPYQSLYRVELAVIYQNLSQATGDIAWQLQTQKVFSDGVRIDPRDQDSWANLAGITLNVAETTKGSDTLVKAKNYYLKSLELDPWFSIANEKLAGIYLMENNLEKAEKHLNNLLAVQETSIFALINLAKLREQEGNNSAAYEFYQRAAEVDPNSTEAKEGLNRIGANVSN